MNDDVVSDYVIQSDYENDVKSDDPKNSDMMRCYVSNKM